MCYIKNIAKPKEPWIEDILQHIRQNVIKPIRVKMTNRKKACRDAGFILYAIVMPFYYETTFLIRAKEAGTDKAAEKVRLNLNYFNAKIKGKKKEFERHEAWKSKWVKDFDERKRYRPPQKKSA